MIARNKMQFPTKEAIKTAVKNTMMATLSPTVNWHFTLKHKMPESVEFEAFILRR